MPLITLTTDLGLSDPYVAMVKGKILSEIPEAQIIDITHNIEPYSIGQASFVFANSFRAFPKGTYHLLAVNTQDTAETNLLWAVEEEQTVIASDNGVLSLVWHSKLPAELYRVTYPRYTSFELYSHYIDLLKKIIQNQAKEISSLTRHIQQYSPWLPSGDENHIRGMIIHVDKFRNAITNISEEHFTKIGRGRKCSIHIKRLDEIDTISKSYADVEASEIVAFFNSMGWLEIGQRHGSATTMLGLKLHDIVQCEFT
jgi:hypothetical protein